MKYTKTFRDSILRKVLPPENRSVSSVSKEMGVAVVTICFYTNSSLLIKEYRTVVALFVFRQIKRFHVFPQDKSIQTKTIKKHHDSCTDSYDYFYDDFYDESISHLKTNPSSNKKGIAQTYWIL